MRRTVAIVSPFPPPYGGMAIQADRLCKGLSGEDIAVVTISSTKPFPGICGPIENLKYLRTLLRSFRFLLELRTIKGADIVHLFAASHEYFFLVVLPTIIAATLFKKRLILNYRGGEADKFLRKWGFIAIPFLKKACKIAVPSTFLINVLRKYHIGNLEILPNIVPAAQFTFKARTRIEPSIIITRHLEPLYNVPCAIRAFEIVKSKYPQAELRIVGTGSRERDLKRMVTEMGLEGVTFCGEVENVALAAYYNESDILLNSSNADNFPGSILEAFACGLVVVSTNVGGISHMIRDGETGLLSETNDHIALADNVICVLENAAFAHKLSSQGREAALKHDWDHVKDKLFELYEINP